MTIDQLRTLIDSRRHFATEHHLSPSDYDSVKAVLKGAGLQRDPNRHVEHFLFEGVRVVRTYEPTG